MVSANAKSKAKSIGIQPKKGYERGYEEDIGIGQPTMKIMGRDIPVLRRWGYDPTEGEVRKEGGEMKAGAEDESTQSTLKGGVDDDLKFPILPMSTGSKNDIQEPPLWGLNLSSPTRITLGNANSANHSVDLPIHQPTAARSYLLKSFLQVLKEDLPRQSPRKKITAKAAAQKREEDAALLLHALDLLFQSWAGVLSKEELDRRAWGWYVAIRPEVKQGEAGWGQRGEVKLGEILGLRRKG